MGTENRIRVTVWNNSKGRVRHARLVIALAQSSFINLSKLFSLDEARVKSIHRSINSLCHHLQIPPYQRHSQVYCTASAQLIRIASRQSTMNHYQQPVSLTRRRQRHQSQSIMANNPSAVRHVTSIRGAGAMGYQRKPSHAVRLHRKPSSGGERAILSSRSRRLLKITLPAAAIHPRFLNGRIRRALPTNTSASRLRPGRAFKSGCLPLRNRIRLHVPRPSLSDLVDHWRLSSQLRLSASRKSWIFGQRLQSEFRYRVGSIYLVVYWSRPSRCTFPYPSRLDGKFGFYL